MSGSRPTLPLHLELITTLTLQISPLAIINPALSHAEVIITSIAARSESTARAYAKKHKIPNVHPTYDALITDPSLDAVYIPLPNGLHYEWATKALAAGKHVLLEKPSTNNAEEAAALITSSSPPVLLEAVHNLFHPAVRKFLTLIDSEKVEEAHASLSLPKGYLGPNDIRLNFSLGGGATMDCGTYCIQILRKIFRAEPVECVEARARQAGFPASGAEVDEAMRAKLRFPSEGTGTIDADLRKKGGYWFPWLTGNWGKVASPVARARERERIIGDVSVGEGEEHAIVREVILWNFIAPFFWHRIDVVDEHTVRVEESGKIIKQWKQKAVIQEYGPPGKEFWTSYRWQLEAFVDKIKGRDEVGVWVSGEDSIKQMKAIDMVYEKAGLPLRPTSEYFKD